MKLKKGTKVEVLSRKELPSGAWKTAEIISGNGHYYCVRYDCPLSVVDDEIVAKVSRKAVRPCPPAIVLESFAAGDIVEVFDNNEWKISKVLRVVGRNFFVVRILGCSQEIRVPKSLIRVRQSWQNERWIVISRSSGPCEDKVLEKLPKERLYEMPKSAVLEQDVVTKANFGTYYLPIGSVISHKESQKVSSRRRKRGLKICSPHVETLMDAGSKRRATEAGRHVQHVSEHPSHLVKKG